MFVIGGRHHNDPTKMRRNAVTGCSQHTWAHIATVGYSHVDRRMQRNLHFDEDDIWEAVVTKKQRRFCKRRGKIGNQKQHVLLYTVDLHLALCVYLLYNLLYKQEHTYLTYALHKYTLLSLQVI